MVKLLFLDKISSKPLNTEADIFADERLMRHIWVECLINPEFAEFFFKESGHFMVSASRCIEVLSKAASWYKAYSYIFRSLSVTNRALETLIAGNTVKPFDIKRAIYNEGIKDFIKGLQCLGYL
jgi:hypothetical protein